MILDFFKLMFISFFPGIELRGAIPFGLATGMNPIMVILVSVFANILLIPIVFGALNFFWEFIKDWSIVERYVERVRRKSKPYVDKYGPYGVFVFVSIPLPGSGVYTGVLISWLFGMKMRETTLPIILGVITAAAAVTVVSMSAISLFGI